MIYYVLARHFICTSALRILQTFSLGDLAVGEDIPAHRKARGDAATINGGRSAMFDGAVVFPGGCAASHRYVKGRTKTSGIEVASHAARAV